MDGKDADRDEPKTPAPEGAEGGNSLADAAEEAAREIEKRRDGSGGYAGEGDIG